MKDNIYMNYINNNPDSPESKNRRRKKRKRARMWAFITFFLVIALLGTGIFFGVKTLINRFAGNEGTVEASANHEDGIAGDAENESEDIKDTLENLLGGETIIAPPEEIVEEPEPDEVFEAWLDEKIASMPIAERILGLFIVRPEQITGVDTVVQAGDGTKAALEQYPVGGILYSEKNIVSEEQFKNMLSNTRQFSKYPVFLMVSEEPGTGVVGKKLGLSSTQNAGEIGATMDPYAAFTANTAIAEYLKNLGIDFNLGIVADVITDTGAEENIMAGRSFGTDPVIVSRMVFESVNAHKLIGMNSAIGYFPGQGGLTADPSAQVVSTVATLDETISTYQEMYKTAVEGGATAIVVSHEYADKLSGDNLPSSLSKDIYTSILREKFALYDTILITDCLDKGAISEYYTSEEACVKALKAGADMLMCPENFEEGYQAVVDAVSNNVIAEARINDALKRVYKIKYRNEFDSLLEAGEIDMVLPDEEGE